MIKNRIINRIINKLKCVSLCKKWAVAVAGAVVVAVAWILTFAPVALSDANGDKIRVGLIESERFDSFGFYLNGIAEGLETIDAISGYSVHGDATDTRAIWEALAFCESDYFVFVQQHFYTMKDMPEQDYSKFTNNSDVDLWFVLGTAAGIYMTENEDVVDYMVFASQNPIAAGIVKSETERFKSNSYAYMDLERIARQIEIGYNIFEFKKIGVVYEDNPGAYAYSGIQQLTQKSEQHGFEVVEKHVSESLNQQDDQRYYRQLKAAYSELIAEGIDALYITVATIEANMLPWLLQDIKQAGIVTISQSGDTELQHGVILGVSQSDFEDEGRYIAEILKQYANGTPIGQLNQVYKIVPKISLNYAALTESGLKLPVKVLLSFDEIIN